MTTERLTILGRQEELNVGDGIFWRAVAQEKPRLRKAILADIAGAKGTYSVRYGKGGVTLRRLADAGGEAGQ